VVFSPGNIPPGSVALRVGIDADEYPADDSRSAGLSLSRPVRVLLIDGDPGRSLIESETFFLGEALSPPVPFGGEPIVTVVSTREEAVRTGLDGYDVVVLANVVPRGELDVAPFLSRGGGIAVFWGDRCRPGDYERYLPNLLPGKIAAVEDAPSGEPYRIGEIDTELELFRPFVEKGAGTFNTAAFLGRAVVRPGEGAVAAARYNDGRPWMTMKKAGSGMVAFVTSTADVQWNDLPTKPVFVPFARRLVLALGGRLGGETGGEVTAGGVIAVPGRSEDAFSRVVFTAPDGSSSAVEFLPEGNGSKAVYKETVHTGLYRYRWQGGEGVFAVNPPTEESFGRPLTDEEIESRFQRVQLEIAEVDGSDVVSGYSQKGALSLSRPLYIALALLLLLEAIVAGPRRNPLSALWKDR
jgi:hypothetical protein